MKNEQSLQRCISASLRAAEKANAGITNALISMPLKNPNPSKAMPALRKHLAELNKAVHELNAYHNCLVTE